MAKQKQYREETLSDRTVSDQDTILTPSKRRMCPQVHSGKVKKVIDG